MIKFSQLMQNTLVNMEAPQFEERIDLVVKLLQQTLENGGLVICAGNGGSMSIAEHLVSDLVKGEKIPETVTRRAICLGSNQVIMSALANDQGYENALRHEAIWHGVGQDDVILSFSVSGTSKNIINLIEHYANKAHIISFTGIHARKEYEGEMLIPIPVPEDAIESSYYYGICEATFSAIAHYLGCKARRQNHE